MPGQPRQSKTTAADGTLTRREACDLYNRGWDLRLGRNGCARDRRAALRLFIRAAEAGHEGAQYSAGSGT